VHGKRRRTQILEYFTPDHVNSRGEGGRCKRGFVKGFRRKKRVNWGRVHMGPIESTCDVRERRRNIKKNREGKEGSRNDNSNILHGDFLSE